MNQLNDWEREPVVHESKIKNTEFLLQHEYIEEIEGGYFCLTAPFTEVERVFYEEQSSKLAKELGIEDIDKELKQLIHALHEYNEVKDIAQSLMGRIADLRGVSVRAIHEELGVSHED